MDVLLFDGEKVFPIALCWSLPADPEPSLEADVLEGLLAALGAVEGKLTSGLPLEGIADFEDVDDSLSALGSAVGYGLNALELTDFDVLIDLRVRDEIRTLGGMASVPRAHLFRGGVYVDRATAGGRGVLAPGWVEELISSEESYAEARRMSDPLIAFEPPDGLSPADVARAQLRIVRAALEILRENPNATPEEVRAAQLEILREEGIVGGCDGVEV